VNALPAPTARQLAHGFVVLAQKTAQTKLTYRLSTLLSLLASACAYCVFLLVWVEVYRRNPTPGPVTRSEMLAYLVIAFLVNSLLVMSFEVRVLQRVRMGLITGDLLRPLGFMPFQLAQATGDLLVNLLYAVPIYAVGFWFVGPALLPASAFSAVLAVVSIGLGFLIAFGVSYVIVQASFVLQSGYGIFFLRGALHQVFSGLSAPLVMFPPPLRAVAEALPFHHEIETPARLWLGLVPAREVPALLATQAAWAFGLILTGELIFSAVMCRHQIQGG
jgi:ABC-2 type transport system permease protein